MKSFILIFILLFFLFRLTRGKNEPFIILSKLSCECLGNFCKFEKCQLKPLRRNVAQASVNVSVFQTPVTNLNINIDLYRKYTIYGSFPINATIDACKFLRNTKKINLLDEIFTLIKKNSNINHSCPFNESYIYAENITAPYSPLFGFMPTGSYLAKTRWIVNGLNRANIFLWFDMNNPKNSF